MGGGDGRARAPQLLGCGGTQYKMPHLQFLIITILFFIAVLKWIILIKYIV